MRRRKACFCFYCFSFHFIMQLIDEEGKSLFLLLLLAGVEFQLPCIMQLIDEEEKSLFLLLLLAGVEFQLPLHNAAHWWGGAKLVSATPCTTPWQLLTGGGGLERRLPKDELAWQQRRVNSVMKNANQLSTS